MERDPKVLRAEARQLRETAAALDRRAHHLETQPKDKFFDGTILTFTREGRYGTGSRRDYVGPLKYAAIKAGDRPECWFLTGLTQYAKTWEDLLDFIGSDNYDTVRTVGWDYLMDNRGPYDHIPPGFRRYH